jgi:hypothetical protein
MNMTMKCSKTRKNGVTVESKLCLSLEVVHNF